jgi:hypothetical protein
VDARNKSGRKKREKDYGRERGITFEWISVARMMRSDDILEGLD